MAMRIDAKECTACGSCEFDCPNAAIKMKGDAYWIDAAKCTECAGQFDSPQCVAACPADAIMQAA